MSSKLDFFTNTDLPFNGPETALESTLTVKVATPALSVKEQFLEGLMRNLILAKNKYPDQYNWPNTDVFEVFNKLAESCRRGTYSRHCHAIRWTCKDLGILCTRNAINAIFKGVS